MPSRLLNGKIVSRKSRELLEEEKRPLHLACTGCNYDGAGISTRHVNTFFLIWHTQSSKHTHHS